MKRSPTKNDELIFSFAEVWKWYKKDDYEVAWGKDGKWAKEYLLHHGGEFDKEKIQQRAKIYMQKDYDWIVEANWGFSAFINNIEKWHPPKWRCDHCREEHSGNINKKKHEEGCSKNPKFKIIELPGNLNEEVKELTKQWSAN